MSQETVDAANLGNIEVRAWEGFVKLVIDGEPFHLLPTEATRLADLLARAATFAVMSADAKAREDDR